MESELHIFLPHIFFLFQGSKCLRSREKKLKENSDNFLSDVWERASVRNAYENVRTDRKFDAKSDV